jgi:threonine synthase
MAEFVYRCSTCRKRYQRDAVRYLCPECAKSYHPGMPLTGVLTAEFDYAAIRRKFRKTKPDWSLFSAVEPEFFPPYAMNVTPFFWSAALGAAFGLRDVWIKNDALLPSGSLKDRASFLVVAEANRLKETTIVTASTGNAASALAAVCAAAGKRAVIFVPESAPRAKLVQMLLYGACVVPVKGTYDDAFRLSLEYTAHHGGLNRNTAYHPLTIEGKKSVGLEILQQNGWRAPSVVVVPTGDGVILGGVYKAFHDLHAAGLIPQLPRLVCVQARKSDAIHRYITTGRYRNAINPTTIADSISVSIPSNAHLARTAVRQSRGFSLTVTDTEILAGQRTLAATTGVFAEPAAAAAVAALAKMRDSSLVKPRDQIVVLITGHGLKDVDAAMKNIRIPAAIEPTPAGVESIASRLAGRGGRTDER